MTNLLQTCLIFLISVINVGLSEYGYLSISQAQVEEFSLGGYASKRSVIQGETIDLHISTDVPVYQISIWREGATRNLMNTVYDIRGSQFDCAGLYAVGCDWPVAYTLEIPESWPSGVYTVDFLTYSEGIQHIMFWVREADPGSTSSMIFLSSVNTYQAYTDFGGKSFYDSNSSDKQRSSIVSFNRPFSYDGLGDWRLEIGLISWAESEGYVLEYATNYDLEFVPGLLDSYEVAVIAGHSEYWSWEMRQQIKAFINRGGRFINLSGNTMWWQVSFEDEGQTMLNYRDPALDPASTREEASTRPRDFPILDAEYAITGTHYRNGGYFGEEANDSTFKYVDGYGGLWVQDAQHWVFEGTELSDGQIFGRGYDSQSSVVGFESDGTTFNCSIDGKRILGPLANTGTPLNFKILAISPVSRSGRTDGFATMGIYKVRNGGAVFSANTTGWPQALPRNSQVAQVTRNVFDRFLANDFPHERYRRVDSYYLFIDRFNCNDMYHEGVLPSYTGQLWWEGIPYHNYVERNIDLNNIQYSDECGIGGGSGLKITVNPEINFRYFSQVKPNWQSSQVIYTRTYLDFSNLQMSEGDSFSPMKFKHDASVEVLSVAQLDVRREGDRLGISYVDKSSDVRTEWLAAPSDQPFIVETKWDLINGEVALWVDGVRALHAINPGNHPGINRVDLLLSGVDDGTQGFLCIDEFAIANRRIGRGLTVTPIRSRKNWLP